MENKTHTGGGSIILAIVILVLGVGFGALSIFNGVSAHADLPSSKEIRRMEEYLELMEELEELLDDPEATETLDMESYLDNKLEECDLSKAQERDIRKLYEDTLAEAVGDSSDREMAKNSLIREIVYYRQCIPNPGQSRIVIRNALLIGGGSILLSLVLFAVLIRKAAAKKK